MTAQEYTEFVDKTGKTPDALVGTPHCVSVMYAAMALAGEAGEAANEVKKVIHSESGVFSQSRRDSLLLELGDVIWYATKMGALLGYSLDDILAANMVKLTARAETAVALRGS